MPSELEFLTKLTFHGMPRRAWNSESMNELINDLGGELVSMFVPPDSWALTVMAWMKKPSTIPKAATDWGCTIRRHQGRRGPH